MGNIYLLKMNSNIHSGGNLMKKITLSLLLASYSHVEANANSIHDKLTANIH